MPDDKSTEDGKHDPKDQAEPQDVEKRLSKLEKILMDTTKTLEEERKASAGKDKKITELAQAKKELMESTLSKDKLLEIRLKEFEEEKAGWDAQRATERAEIERLRVEQLRTQVISKLDNFPSFLMDRVRGNTAEEIEADAREILKKWVKERDKVENVRKVTGKPQSGAGRQSNISVEELRSMNPADQKKIIYEMYKGKGRMPNPEADNLMAELSE